jgi:hypothetical protein
MERGQKSTAQKTSHGALTLIGSKFQGRTANASSEKALEM